MSKKIFRHKFKFLLFLILLLGLVIRLFAIRDNNFYFTMDQGRDAVYVRDILHGHHSLMGPAASIEGIFTGPLWYYFLALGFLLSGGHPVAGPILLIITQLVLITSLALILKKNFGENKALAVSLIILISPEFFETSIYAFNPFLLPILTLIILLALAKVNKEKPYLFLLAGLATGLVIHVQIASLLPLIITTFIYGVYLIYKKDLAWEYFVFGWFFMGLAFIPHLISELQTNFAQIKAGLDAFQNADTGVQVANNHLLNQFILVAKIHLELIGKSIFANNYLLGLLFLLASLASTFKFKKHKLNLFTKKLLIIFVILLISSWLWFAVSTGLHSWHLLGLPIIILTLISLMILNLPKKIKYIFISLLIIFQIVGLTQRLRALESEHSDQSMLSTQLAAIDWIYAQSENKSFAVYNYLPSIKDYPYQYLFWWQGRQKYGYLPCHYASDKMGASSYVPHANNYQEKNPACSGLVFLIIEPAIQTSLQNDWHTRVSKSTELLVTQEIGKIKIEKRQKLTSN